MKAVYRETNGDFGRISPESRQILMHELGDVLWYAGALASKLGRGLDEVARLDGPKRDERERRRGVKGQG